MDMVRFPITDSIEMSVGNINKGFWSHGEDFLEVALYDMSRKYITDQYFAHQGNILRVKPNDIIKIIDKVRKAEQKRKDSILESLESVKNLTDRKKDENIRTKEQIEKQQSKRTYKLKQKFGGIKNKLKREKSK